MSKQVKAVFRYCAIKDRGGYGNALVTFNACLNCPDCVFGEHDRFNTYEIWCRHSVKDKFLVMVDE